MINRFLRITFILAGLGLLYPVAGSAEIPKPIIHEPEGEGVKCVHPEDEMKRNHMNYILHQRDDTMYDGIRTEKHSLANCIDCHVQPGEDGKIASVDSKDHFCKGCHEYAAVTIDCFECHADRPQKFIKRGGKKNASLQQDLHTMLSASTESGEQ